jgi:L-alanine-DL-glutamate epimerase-like enolase superfamily enzyme
MKILSVDSFPVRLRRELAGALGTAGSPAQLRGEAGYRWAESYPCLYSTALETALVRVRLDNGVEGWGEAQAPVAPEVACTIVDRILAPILRGEEFDPAQSHIAHLWQLMYSTMRVRGQTGGFMLDAISGIDIALWDAAGKCRGESVRAMLGAEDNVAAPPVYLSGVAANGWEAAGHWHASGVQSVKLYHSSTTQDLLDRLQRARAIFGDHAVAVDALWRLDPASAPDFCDALRPYHPLFLECPFPPEEVAWHAGLGRTEKIPLAAGESYRTCYEVRPLLASGAIRYLQPDLGRCGFTEGLRLAALAAEHHVPVVPHVSIAQAPQLAAAIHFAAYLGRERCPMVEFNPAVLAAANRYVRRPISVAGGAYHTPIEPGLGIEFTEDAPWLAS